MRKRIVPTWLMIAKGLSQFGWQTEMIKEDRIIFVLGKDRIDVKKLPKTKKWKVERYTSGKLEDIAGIGTEREVKIIASELAIIRGSW